MDIENDKKINIKKELEYTGQNLTEKNLKSILVEAEVISGDEEESSDESNNYVDGEINLTDLETRDIMDLENNFFLEDNDKMDENMDEVEITVMIVMN
nr:11478_t:CDS:2 [Entrophospora candida]